MQLKQTKIQAEEALNDLKKQIDENSRKLYEEMREQVRFQLETVCPMVKLYKLSICQDVQSGGRP